MSTDPHRLQTPVSVKCAVVTVSDTRTMQTDTSGALIRKLLENSGHFVVGYEILPDDAQRVRERTVHWCDRRRAECVILTGGTGLSPRDMTYEAVAGLLTKTLDGFGELFRMLSFREIGAAAMLSRALGGVRGKTAVFSLPGSMSAVRLAMERLILPELGHVVGLLSAPVAPAPGSDSAPAP